MRPVQTGPTCCCCCTFGAGPSQSCCSRWGQGTGVKVAQVCTGQPTRGFFLSSKPATQSSRYAENNWEKTACFCLRVGRGWPVCVHVYVAHCWACPVMARCAAVRVLLGHIVRLCVPCKHTVCGCMCPVRIWCAVAWAQLRHGVRLHVPC